MAKRSTMWKPGMAHPSYCFMASLVGQSMGGGISVYVAAHYPERVDRLILVDPAVIPYPMTTIGKIYQFPFVGEFMNAIPGEALMKNNIKTIWFYDKNKATG